MFKITIVNCVAIVLCIFAANFVSCVPTSVLVKDTKLSNNYKGKSSSNEKVLDLESFQSLESNAGNRQQEKQGSHGLTSSGIEATSTAGQQLPLNTNEEPSQILQKRGVNSQLAPLSSYGNDYYNPIHSRPPISGTPNGLWSDEIDPALIYQDLQDLDEYPRAQYKYKPYDNLQNIWNSETYSEPIALPVQYPYRYYGDRKKRSSKLSKYDSRDSSKLTPADVLALVALVEAGERERGHHEGDVDDTTNTDYMKSYYPGYEYQPNNDETDYNNAWLEPTILDYYGMPYNLDSIPKYEVAREPKFNRYPSKRYMIAKKKRSLGHFLNEPVASPSISFNPPAANMDKDENRPTFF